MEGPTPLDGGWILAANRILTTEIERFLTPNVAVPILKNVRGTGNNRIAHIGCELHLLVDRNAVEDGTFDRGALATPASPGGSSVGAVEALPATPWTLGLGWSIDNTNHKARHVPVGSVGNLAQAGSIIAGASYTAVFTVSGRTSGSVALDLGGTAGTSRSTNATFTETIVAGAGTDFAIVPSADFNGFVDSVTIYPDVAPRDLDVSFYTVRNCLITEKSTEPFKTLTFPSASKLIMRRTLWIDYKEACSGFTIGNILPAAYAAGNLYFSAWYRRYAWGPGM